MLPFRLLKDRSRCPSGRQKGNMNEVYCRGLEALSKSSRALG